MNKISIVGSSGSGKSTTAVKLGNILDLPVYHLDKYFQRPGWVMVDLEVMMRTNLELVQKDKWIIDGNYISTMDFRFSEADTIIFLDFSRIKCLSNVFHRFIRFHGKSRPDVGTDCRESLDFELVKWIWDYPKRFRPITYEKIELFGKGREAFILKNPKEVNDFLQNLRPQQV